MAHPWFRDVNWEHVLSKQNKPPIIPDINSSYFDREESSDGEETQLNVSRFI